MMIREQERRKGGFECFALQWTPLFIVVGGGGGGVWTKTTMDEDEREVFVVHSRHTTTPHNCPLK
jgi:hypothetical protein